MQMNQHTIVSINVMSWVGDCSSFAGLWLWVGLCGHAYVLHCGIAKTALPQSAVG